MIQASSLDVLEVILRYPCVPMLLQRTGGPIAIQQLAKRIFVNDIGVVRVLKNARSDPWLPGVRQTPVNTRDAAL